MPAETPKPATAFADGAIVPPIQLSTTFARDADGGYASGYSYSRTGNPNRQQLEAELCALESGHAAFAFASGMAATMAVFQSLATGDHALVPKEAYHGTQTMLREIFPRWGLSCDFIDMTDPGVVRAALRPNTRLIWVESPSNPRLRLTDIRQIAALAHGAGAICVADNTLATPLGQNPLALGCDVVMHATTKYLNGHSDAMGGVLIVREPGALAQRLAAVQGLGGAVPSPFDCWLIQRGLRTLRHRFLSQCATAQEIAAFLAAQPAVAVVHYPGLASHPQQALAASQMRLNGGLLAFELRGGRDAAFAMLAQLQLIRRATSLGGVETLIEHRASIEGPHSVTPPGLVRLAVGLEPAAELRADLAQALAALPDAQ